MAIYVKTENGAERIVPYGFSEVWEKTATGANLLYSAQTEVIYYDSGYDNTAITGGMKTSHTGYAAINISDTSQATSTCLAAQLSCTLRNQSSTDSWVSVTWATTSAVDLSKVNTVYVNFEPVTLNPTYPPIRYTVTLSCGTQSAAINVNTPGAQEMLSVDVSGISTSEIISVTIRATNREADQYSWNTRFLINYYKIWGD